MGVMRAGRLRREDGGDDVLVWSRIGVRGWGAVVPGLGELEVGFDPSNGGVHQREAVLCGSVAGLGGARVPLDGLLVLGSHAAAGVVQHAEGELRLDMILLGRSTVSVHRLAVRTLVDALGERDRDKAQKRAKSIGGPVGEMLATGVQHMAEPRELIEEVMYEKMLATRLRLQKALPFIAITAASAPLLGLLGTVTGIINTFQMITLFGTGDVKNLSGGISEALVTTATGLIVALPGLFRQDYLRRRHDAYKAFLAHMETVCVQHKHRSPPQRKQAA